MFVLDCIYKFCSCVHEQWYSVILVCCSLKPWLNPGYSCLLASETRAFSTFFGSHERKSNATLKQSYQQTLGLRSGKRSNSLLILSKKSNKTHQKSPIPWLPYPVPIVPAPALAMGNFYLPEARLGGRILSEGLAQLAAATWMRKKIQTSREMVGDVIVPFPEQGILSIA